MAAVSLTSSVAKTQTLSAATADTVTVTAATVGAAGGSGEPSDIEIVNLSATAADIMWAKKDGTATVAGTDCIPIPASSAYIFRRASTISVISAGTPQYTVDRLV